MAFVFIEYGFSRSKLHLVSQIWPNALLTVLQHLPPHRNGSASILTQHQIQTHIEI